MPERLQLSSLRLDPENLRLHDGEHIAALKASLLRWGQQRPVLITADGLVVAGNGLVMAMRALDWDACECTVTTLEGDERTAYAMADNRLAELSSWSKPMLRSVIERLPTEATRAAGWTEKTARGMIERQADEERPHTVVFSGEQWLVVKRAIDQVRTATQVSGMPAGRVIELIVADFLAGESGAAR